MNESRRKHYTQMTKNESLFLFQQAMKVKEWDLHGHVRKQMQERGMMDKEELVDILRFGDLIEFHFRNGQPRILVRGTKVYYKYVPCAVFEISTGKVITVYWNHENDDHRTIDMSRYDEEMDVVDTYNKAV